MLLLADRGLVSFDLWRTMATTAADLLWRTRTNAVLPVVQTLADGSYRSQIVAARDTAMAATRSPCGWWRIASRTLAAPGGGHPIGW
jgi:hypothetical protein